MKKKVIAIVLSTAIALSLGACTGSGQSASVSSAASGAASGQAEGQSGTTAPAADAVVLKLAFNQSENHPQYKALAEMGEKLKEQTNGKYVIEIHPNELLGSQKDAFELVQNGSVQMAMVANSIVENVNKDFAVLGLPYIYDSQEHQKKVFTSDALDQLFADTSAANNGFDVLTAFTAGARSVYTDKPIHTTADLKGYKIRVMESPTCISMLNYMGGVGTPMSQGEVYTAIQQGTINGGENNEITYADLKHYEVAPYFSYTQHMMVPDLLIINTDIHTAMPDDVKEIFSKLVDETTEREFQLWNEQIDAAKKTAVDGGATFVEDVDIKPFQEAVKPLHDEVSATSENAKKLYDAVRALAE